MQIFRWFRWFDKPATTTAPEHISLGIGGDTPISSANEDRLRRINFANRIAEILSEVSLEEGRIFAIRGSWGDGKSSLKNLIIEKLPSHSADIEWLEFNPWQWGDADSIAQALFKQISDKLGGKYSSVASERAKTFRRYGALLTGMAEQSQSTNVSAQTVASILTGSSVVALAGAIGFGLPSAAVIATVVAGAGIAVPFVGRIMSALGRDKWTEPLDEIRNSLEKSLRALDHPLVVFVDDIDRLEPDQIRLLIRQVKVNANLPNIVFVLLFQPSIVEAALNPIAENQGREFLQKIVQANFDLPAVPKSLVHRLFAEELSLVASTYATEENGFYQVRWGNVLIGCIQPYIGNLRDSRRLLTSMMIHIPLHVGTDAFEVNIIDLLALETLRVFEPDLHLALFENRDLVLQVARFSGDGRDKEFLDRLEKLVEIVPEDRRKIARNVIREIFPTVEWAFGGSHYGDSWSAEWLNTKRVCTSRFFPRYFELQTPEGEISESEFANFLSQCGNRRALTSIIEGIRNRELLPSLAARLDESVERLPSQHAAVLLPAMFRIGQIFAGSKSAEPFNSPWVSAWRAISWYIEKIPAPERGKLTLKAFRETKALSVAAILIHLNDPSDRDEKERDSFEPKLDSKTLQSMKKEWLKQVRALAANGSALAQHKDLGSLLHRWRDYSGSFDEPKAWVSEEIKADKGFVRIIDALMSTGTSQAWGDKVASQVDRFDRETIDNFIGLQEARSRIESLRSGKSVNGPHRSIEVLREHLEEWPGGKSSIRRGRI